MELLGPLKRIMGSGGSQTEGGDMYCPQCGKEYTERVNYCCQCGTALAAPVSIHGKKLMRSRKDHKIAGVCGGFAEYLGLDSTLVRIVWLMMMVFAGSGLLAYIIAWVVMPEEPLSRAAMDAPSLAVPQPAGNR